MVFITFIVQIFLALAMLYYSIPKLIFSKEKLKHEGGREMEYVDSLSKNQLLLIGIIEFSTSVGLILPKIFNQYSWIIILSSLVIIAAMIVAIILHINRNDGAKAVLINILYIFMSIIVILGNQI